MMANITGNAPYIYHLISLYDVIVSAPVNSTDSLALKALLHSTTTALTTTTTTTTTTTMSPLQQDNNSSADLLGLGAPSADILPMPSPPVASDTTPSTVALVAASSTFLTLGSVGGLFFGIINVVGNFGTVFVDQSYWQLSVAAKPRDGVLGFLLGGLVWFGVPLGFATTMSSGYLALCGAHGQALLTPDQVNAGLVPPFVASMLLGKAGAFLVMILVYMAVLSTAAAEVIAVASLIVFDVYRIYLVPFRPRVATATNTSATASAAAADAAMLNACMMCGKPRGRLTTRNDGCACIPLEQCSRCLADDRQHDAITGSAGGKHWQPVQNSGGTGSGTAAREYTCTMHADYRKYQDHLSAKKNWAVCLCSMALVPLTIFLYEIGVSLAWLYLAMGIVIGSAVVPISLAVTWARLTRNAVLIGSIGGCFSAIVVWLVLAGVLYDGGLYDFFGNTGRDVPMLFGNLTALLLSAVLTVVISLWETRDGMLRVGPMQTKTDDEQELWRMTMDIDNPLFPWSEMYQKELGLKKTDALDQRPSVASLARAFRRIKWLGYVGSIVLTLGMLVFWPAVASTLGTFTQSQYVGWISVTTGWTFLGALAIIIIPAWSEIRHALDALRRTTRYTGIVGVADNGSVAMNNNANEMNGINHQHHESNGHQADMMSLSNRVVQCGKPAAAESSVQEAANRLLELHRAWWQSQAAVVECSTVAASSAKEALYIRHLTSLVDNSETTPRRQNESTGQIKTDRLNDFESVLGKLQKLADNHRSTMNDATDAEMHEDKDACAAAGDDEMSVDKVAPPPSSSSPPPLSIP